MKYLDIDFKSVEERLVCHLHYNMRCQKQEAMFFFGTIHQIMMQLNIGHFIVISNSELQYHWPTKESIHDYTFIQECVC